MTEKGFTCKRCKKYVIGEKEGYVKVFGPYCEKCFEQYLQALQVVNEMTRF